MKPSNITTRICLGNHMTRGAVDLVQAELSGAFPAFSQEEKPCTSEHRLPVRERSDGRFCLSSGPVNEVGLVPAVDPPAVLRSAARALLAAPRVFRGAS